MFTPYCGRGLVHIGNKNSLNSRFNNINRQRLLPYSLKVTLQRKPSVRSYGDDSAVLFQRRTGVNFGICIVPQGELWVIERFGKYTQTLGPGLSFLVPFIDQIAYKHSIKEVAFPIRSQAAITKDNVQIAIDGVCYLKVVDAQKASYSIENVYFAISNLAQTTMRAEIGKLSLDKTFSERQSLNLSIVDAISSVAQNWGIVIERYEIKDMTIPSQIRAAMELEAEAERRKRQKILESEAQRLYETNVAEGKKRATILSSEAQMSEEMNIANGDVYATKERAKAQAEAIKTIADAISKNEHGVDAVSLQLAKEYIQAFGKLAQRSTTLLLPVNPADTASMVSQALATFQTIKDRTATSVSSNGSEKAAASAIGIKTKEAALETLTDELSHANETEKAEILSKLRTSSKN